MAQKLSIEIGLEGGKEIQRQLQDIGEQGQKAFLDIANAAQQVGGFSNLKVDDVTKQLIAMGVTGVKELNAIGAAFDTALRTEKLQAGMRTLEQGFALLSGGLSGLVKNFGLIGSAIAAAETAFSGLAGAIGKSREAMTGLDQAAIKSGLSLAKFDQLRQGFERAGVSAKGVEAAMEGIAAAADKAKLDAVTAAIRNLAAASNDSGAAMRARPADFALLRTAAEGVGPAADAAREALTQLGVAIPLPGLATGARTLQDFIAKTGDAVTGTAAFVESLRKMPDSANRSALAIDAFKGAGAELVQLLRTGAITNDQFKERLGGLSQAAALSAAAIEQSFNRSAAAWVRFKQSGDASELILIFSEVANRASISFGVIGEELATLGGKIGELASAVGGAIWDTFASGGIAAISSVSAALDTLIGKIKDVASAMAGISAGGGGPGSVTPAPGNARGGLIGGRGSGTSDSNLAWLSRGEYVMPARAVRQPGMLAFLEALRRSGSIPGFAEGGAVGGGSGSGSGSGASGFLESMIKFLADLGQSVAAIYPPVRETVLYVRDTLFDMVRNLHGGLTSVVGTIESAISRLMSALKDARNAQSAQSAQGKARGGLLGGRGSGTSDSNLAWVSRGEHIMPARAVRQPGVLAFLEALRRSGGDLSRVLDRMGHFAMGGPVGLPALGGGGAGGMSNVTIQFPGLPEISGLRASSDVVEQLQRAAALAQVRSGGRKPSRYS